MPPFPALGGLVRRDDLRFRVALVGEHALRRHRHCGHPDAVAQRDDTLRLHAGQTSVHPLPHPLVIEFRIGGAVAGKRLHCQATAGQCKTLLRPCRFPCRLYTVQCRGTPSSRQKLLGSPPSPYQWFLIVASGKGKTQDGDRAVPQTQAVPLSRPREKIIVESFGKILCWSRFRKTIRLILLSNNDFFLR